MWFCAIIEYWNQQKDRHINELSRLLPVLAPVNGALIQYPERRKDSQLDTLRFVETVCLALQLRVGGR